MQTLKFNEIIQETKKDKKFPLEYLKDLINYNIDFLKQPISCSNPLSAIRSFMPLPSRFLLSELYSGPNKIIKYGDEYQFHGKAGHRILFSDKLLPFSKKNSDVKYPIPFSFPLYNNETVEILQSNIYYYEVTLTNTINLTDHEEPSPCVSIGFGTKLTPFDSHVGWYANSVGYHSDDGTVRVNQSDKSANKVSKNWAPGDIGGAGVIWFGENKVKYFFTLNGKVIWMSNEVFELSQNIFPIIGYDHPNSIQVNFSNNKFKFDLKKMIANHSSQIISTENSFIDGYDIGVFLNEFPSVKQNKKMIDIANLIGKPISELSYITLNDALNISGPINPNGILSLNNPSNFNNLNNFINLNNSNNSNPIVMDAHANILNNLNLIGSGNYFNTNNLMISGNINLSGPSSIINIGGHNGPAGPINNVIEPFIATSQLLDQSPIFQPLQSLNSYSLESIPSSPMVNINQPGQLDIVPLIGTITSSINQTGPSLLATTHNLGQTGPSLLATTHNLGQTGPSLLATTHNLGQTGPSLLATTHNLGQTGPSLLTTAHNLWQTGPSLLATTHNESVTSNEPDIDELSKTNFTESILIALMKSMSDPLTNESLTNDNSFDNLNNYGKDLPPYMSNYNNQFKKLGTHEKAAMIMMGYSPYQMHAKFLGDDTDEDDNKNNNNKDIDLN